MALNVKLPDALAVLACSYERDGLPIQSIHCLQALLGQQLPSDFEAKARLHMGRLLLAHTYNFKEALSHLLKAQILARELIGNYCLKYEVHDQLATFYGIQGDDAKELQAYAAVSELWKSARGSDDWPAVCGWVCRMAQRAAALHARQGRPEEADRAVAEGLAFAEVHGLLLQKAVFLLMSVHLSLSRWDDDATTRALAALSSIIANLATPGAAGPSGAGAAAGASAATSAPASGSGAAGPPAGRAAAGALDHSTNLGLVLHYKLLQVMHLLRQGKVSKVTREAQEQQQPGQQQPAQAQGEGGPDPDGPDAPPPEMLGHLDSTLTQLRAAVENRAALQQQQPQQQGPQPQQQKQQQQPGLLPYDLPGLLSLEPLVCLVCACALRAAHMRPRLTERYLERGLSCTSSQLAACGLLVDESAALDPRAVVDEKDLAPQALEAVRPALQLHLLLLTCRAQIRISKAELVVARDQVLGCQRLMERFPGLLASLQPGLHVLTGQYCVATGELAKAAAHFAFARVRATNRPAAALAAVLEAAAHLAPPPPPAAGTLAPGQQGQPEQQQQQQGEGLASERVGRALAALGPFYRDPRESPQGPGAYAAAALPGKLGYLEEAACLMASAACLAEQGQLARANLQLSHALKTAFHRVANNQLVCAILNELVPTFLAQGDARPAQELATSSITFARTAGDPWAEGQGKRRLAAVHVQQGEQRKAAVASTSAVRQEQRVVVATTEALADIGRHEYATGWGLGAVRS